MTEKICKVIENEKMTAEHNDSGVPIVISLVPALDNDGNKALPIIKESEIIGMQDDSNTTNGVYRNNIYADQGDLTLLHDDITNKIAEIVDGELNIFTTEDDPSKYSKQDVDLIYDNG